MYYSYVVASTCSLRVPGGACSAHTATCGTDRLESRLFSAAWLAGNQGSFCMHAQVGPRGVHLEKDNVFNSQAYAAGAPAITISNVPSSAAAAGSTGSTAAAGTYPAAAQPSTSSTYGNGQSVYGSSQGAQNGYGSSSTDPTATPSGYSVGRRFMPHLMSYRLPSARCNRKQACDAASTRHLHRHLKRCTGTVQKAARLRRMPKPIQDMEAPTLTLTAAAAALLHPPLAALHKCQLKVMLTL